MESAAVFPLPLLQKALLMTEFEPNDTLLDFTWQQWHLRLNRHPKKIFHSHPVRCSVQTKPQQANSGVLFFDYHVIMTNHLHV